MDRIRGATLVSDIQVHRPIPLLPAIRHDNALLDSTSPKKTSPPHAEHFYLITYTRGRARRRPGAVQPKRPLAMRTQAMPATCSRSGRPASNPRPTRPGPPPAPLRRSGGDGRPAAAHAADSRFPHDVHHPAAADPGRIPALRRRPGARLAAPVHGHEGTGMGLEDAAGRRLAPGGHAAAACPDPGPSAAWRDEPAARRAGRRPAGWPDPETVPEPVDASDRQRRAGPSLAAKKPTPPSISRSRAPIARPRPANPSTPPSHPRPGCLVSAATAAPVLSRQRRSVSGATPGSPAT